MRLCFAGKGRLEEAEAALSWLRGWVKPNHVRFEYRALLDRFHEKPTDEPIKKSGRVFEPFFDKSFYRPLATITVVYFVHFFSGVSALLTFSIILFEKMQSPGEPVALMGAMRVAGALVVFFCIRLTGKRRLIFTGLLVSSSSYFLVFWLNFIDISNQWISPSIMILAIFANSFGVDSIVHMLNTEVFPVSIRYIGSSIGSSIGAVMQSAMSKAFLYMLDALTLPGLFFYLGIMNLLAIVTYYFVFPETEGRTLQEIEDHFNGTKRLEK